MTRAEAFARLNHIRTRGNGDPEINHAEADDVLCELLKSLGCEDVVYAFLAIDRWYA